jgi:hypothetical protein
MNPSVLLLGLILPLAASATQPASSAWKEFHCKPGGFKVLLPGVPQQQKQSLQTPVGAVELILFVLEPTKGQGAYAVSYSELSQSVLKQATPQQRLEHARDSAVARAKGMLRSDKRIAWQGHPGLEFEIAVDGQVRIRTRLIAVKNRLYQILVVGPPAWLSSKDSGRFLDSLQLMP